MLISAPAATTWSLVAFLFLLRAVSMMTSAVGAMVMEQQLGSLHASRLPGAGVRMPWAAAAYLLGGLGLVGFPLGAGFAGYWAALQLVAESDWRSAAAVLVAASVAIIAFIRMGRLLFGPLADPYIPRESTLSAALAALMVAISVGLAVAPQLLDGMVGRALLAFGM
jgi:multicomponent Na+:H+ antiporter subunit D